MELLAFHKNGRRIIIKNKDVSNNNDFGNIAREDLIHAKNGEVVKTSKGEELTIVHPSFVDNYFNMSKGAQSIKLKDCSLILAETMVGKDSVCLDCGAGMGGLTCFLAHYVKKVYSVDQKKEHLDNARKNAEMLGLSNVDFIEKDIREGFPETEKLDLITLDLMDAETVIKNAKDCLKVGGFLVGYCPQANQMQAFVVEMKNQGLMIVNALEVNTRFWKVEEKILRPEHMGLQHTGFLVFGRKIFD